MEKYILQTITIHKETIIKKSPLIVDIFFLFDYPIVTSYYTPVTRLVSRNRFLNQ